MTEKKLIAGLKRGDMDAWEEAFHLWYPKFVHFAEYIVKDLSIAKDLVQNVFLKVWRFRDRLDPEGSLQNFLFVLTKREVLNYLRTQREFESLDDLLDLPAFGPPPDGLADEHYLHRQVSKLPEQRRRVFILSRYFGIPNKEIARMLTISEKTAERHITLAGKQLRDGLKEKPLS